MFCEASENEIKNPWQITAPLPEEKFRKFTSSAQRLYKLNKVLKGIKEFYPVAFDNLHFSTVSLTLHSVLMGNQNFIIILIDFKFRKYMISDSFKESNNGKSLESGIRIVKIRS